MTVPFSSTRRVGGSGCFSSRRRSRAAPAAPPDPHAPRNPAGAAPPCNLRHVVLLVAAWFLLACPAAVRAQSVWELTPYRVRVLVDAADLPELRAGADRLAEELSPRLENLLGAAWQVETAGVRAPLVTTDAPLMTKGALTPRPHVWRLPAGATDAARLPGAWRKGDPDKVLMLRVEPAADGWRLDAREWDAATWRLGPVLAYPVRHPAKLRDTAVRAVLEAFRPLARIDRVETGPDGQRTVLRLRAGGLPTRDPELHLVHAGQLFCPVIRLNDREGRLRRDREGNPILPQPVPWTFLVAEGVEAAEVPCRVETGLGAPLSASRRGRTEQLALGVVPRLEPTRLTLLARREPHHPIAGYQVFLQRPGEKATRPVGRTDRAGSVEVAPTGDPLAILLVRSGQQLLARLPVVAGSAGELTAYVPDDTERLEAEAFVTALQEELVDTVTRREVLLARAEAQLEAGRLDEARQLRDRLHQLPDRETLRRRLTTRRSQLRSSDPHVQRQIETLFGDTSKLLDRHLDPAPVDALSQSLARHTSPRPKPAAEPADEDGPKRP